MDLETNSPMRRTASSCPGRMSKVYANAPSSHTFLLPRVAKPLGHLLVFPRSLVFSRGQSDLHQLFAFLYSLLFGQIEVA